MTQEHLPYSGHRAPNFAARMQTQDYILARLRTLGETEFPKAEGDYSCISLYAGQRNERAKSDEVPVNRLTGMEAFYASRTQELLDAGGKPVVLLDAGGMAGLSWCRLANRFRNEVAQGRAVFAVSNIAFDPARDLAYIDNFTEEEAGFIRKSSELVHYLQSDAVGLSEQVIETPQGSIPLQGNVDLINEVSSITFHSQVPERDIVAATVPLCSNRGSYFVYDSNPSIYFGGSVSDFHARQSGIGLAREEIKRNGLMQVKYIEAGRKKGRTLSFDAFRMKDAPLIRFD